MLKTKRSRRPSEMRGPRRNPARTISQTHPKTQSSTPRQVIAVSASKGPAAFFNLARKFLVTDETVDLSALEGAIVSAVDAAHLLERSKLATIVRYVKKMLFLVPLFTVVTLYLLPTCSTLL